MNPYLAAYRQSSKYGQPVASAPPASTPKGPTGVTGFLINNLPTIGGVVGGIAGIPLNALDAVSGVGGTALNIGLAGAGSAAGEALKEKLLGQNLDAGNIALQGGLGAAGEGVGGVLAKGAGKVLPKLIGRSDAPVTDALNNYANKNIAKQLASNLPPGALKTGRDVGKLYGQADLARDIGLYGAGGRKAAANIVTGENGAVNGIKKGILAQSGHVPVLDDLETNITKAITENGVAGKAEQQAVRNAVSAQVQKAVGTKGAVGDMTIDASKAFKAQQALEKLGATAASTGKTELAGAYRQVARNIGEQLDTHAGVNAAVAAYKVPTDVAKQIAARSVRALGNAKGKRLATYITDAVNNAKTLPELRHVESNFIPGSQAATNAEIKGLQGTGGPGLTTAAAEAAGGGGYGKLNFIKQAVTSSAPARAAVAGGAARAGGVLEPGTRQTIQRLLGQGATRGVLGQPNDQSAQNAQAAQDSALAQQQAALAPQEEPGLDAGTLPGNSQSAGGNVFTPEVLQQLAIRDIEQTGGKNLGQISTLAGLFGPGAKTNTASSTEAATISNGQSALRQLQSLREDIANGNGSVGPVSGRVRSLNPTDTAEQTLKSKLNIVAQVVAKGLEGGKLSDQDIKRYRDMLPSITDTSEVAQAKIAHVESLLQDQLQSYSQLVGQ